MTYNDLTSNRGVATACQVGRNSLMAYLRQGCVLTRANLPTERVLDAGFAIVSRDLRGNPVTRWTPEGVQWLQKVVARAIGNGALEAKPVVTLAAGSRLERTLKDWGEPPA